MFTSSFRFFFSFLSCLLCLSTAALGQVTTGAVSGTVTDETLAVLPGVEVTITNVDTGITRMVVCDDAGLYRATNLNVGHYQVSASLAGFQTTVRSGIVLTMLLCRQTW